MSAATPASPTVTRSSSTSRRQQQASYTTTNPPDRPHRSHSTAVRPSVSHHSSTPHRSQSQSHGHGRPGPPVAYDTRRDAEQTNLARSSSSRRSESRDRDRSHASSTSHRAEPTRNPHQHTRRTSDVPSHTQQPPTNGIAMDNPGSSHKTGGTRRRTTIGTPSGQWALGKTIGAGSMGKVKLAKHLETGEQVAVKIVPRHSTDDHRTPQEKERADHSKEVRTAREAAIVSLVSHPYICGMRDFVRTNYHWYMLFEYVNGGQMLDYIISHGRLKEKPARKFARQIASALDYCHRNSIVHRDLKIENILISKTGDIKIIDFGLSNLFAPQNYLKTFCGSLYFAAPELLQARQYTGPEVDIWSFGIVLYVLVCGKVPFDDQSMPQLHAKIKKGYVDYPPWLSTGKFGSHDLHGPMLVTDPRQRATLTEIINHPWMTKGFNSAPDNFLPHREPLSLPLDAEVIDGMVGFDFGPPEFITNQLTKVIESEEYQAAIRNMSRKQPVQTPETERKRGVFDFYKRRNSLSRDTLTNPSKEEVQLGADPVNAFSPLISIYYLVREKQDRERTEKNPGAFGLPKTEGEGPFDMPQLQAPEAAYTNQATYELKGEKPTGGRSRPRARTQGEDEVQEGVKNMNLGAANVPVSPALVTPPIEPTRKESTAGAILRRLSTRRHRDRDRDREKDLEKEKVTNPPPSVSVAPSPGEPPSTEQPSTPRKSFSVRRNRKLDAPASATSFQGTTQHQQPEFLSPASAGGDFSRRLKGLGRSTSVNSAEIRRRIGRHGASDDNTTEPPATSGSDRSSLDNRLKAGDAASDDQQPAARPRTATTSRTKSLGHARRESIQARRAQREQAREDNLREETDAEIEAEADARSGQTGESLKPVYLKGLFSASTTSSKPLPVIRSDIIRVLKQKGVVYNEIKGGFNCTHLPSIDPLPSQEGSPSLAAPTPSGHRRKISFGGLRGNDRDRDRDEFRDTQRPAEPQRSPRNPGSRRDVTDRSFTGSDDSDGSEGAAARERERGGKRREPRERAAGETTTHVQNDVGRGAMALRFEIFVVKVPLFQLYGIQFKKVDGNIMQYKNLAQEILNALRL
ncbi:Pkinase-domain-containing protein [Eremomyces bilateralis CBS 781.70]|uniref:non-specific serine/threonine protein kinase n=1 Tax=Eremomyces bilateralis CBS 781.70 TaxID=1392243 RepID=A0A6G1G8P8_9PEZI|nr:Pkinase-domain-containing protein [Eremomyces bilateralis CBS 781.70]KAF1814306.1 Pkinase-domain-containing protein [Eremomyces bilateralis CBS 781.70]